MNRSRTFRIVLYATLIFLAGAITGAFVAPHLGRSFMRPPDAHQMSRHMLDRLRSGLHLSDEQAAQIKPLLEKTASDMETIRHETTRRVLDRITETNRKISSLLTPEQRVQFIKMEEEHRKHLRHHHPFAGPPEPPPPPPPP